MKKASKSFFFNRMLVYWYIWLKHKIFVTTTVLSSLALFAILYQCYCKFTADECKQMLACGRIQTGETTAC